MTIAMLKRKVQKIEDQLQEVKRLIEMSPKKSRATIWHESAGMLKGKLPSNPVAWQRRIRATWDR